MNYEEQIEYQILKLIKDYQAPIGATTIALLLKNNSNQSLSQASIGRRLIEMDHRGLTRKIKKAGRVLTEKGLERLKALEQQVSSYEAKIDFLSSLNTQNLDKLIQVLIARRGLEKESARLAAMFRTDEQLAKMQEILHLQKLNLDEGKPVDLQDIEFHDLIAEASKNMVIYNALKLIRRESQYSPFLATIRLKIGGKVYYEHSKIFENIKDKNPKGAEAAMEAHLDRIIAEIENYFGASLIK